MVDIMSQVLKQTEIPALAGRRGKVRDIYDLGDRLLLVATDRISAFDVVLPTPIPDKGVLLTQVSRFWFDRFHEAVPHHLDYVVTRQRVPAGLEKYADQLVGRAMVCKKAKVLPVECVVRGYLAGSGWKEYGQHQSVCGVKLPAGLKQCSQLPQPIFTPTTKAEQGHDEPITIEQAGRMIGADLAKRVADLSIQLYSKAAEYARGRGVIIADTKFEFGTTDTGQVILIDEVLTPDSSRFWPADQYEPGHDQPSFDKQFVRNYLEGLVDKGQWNKQPPGPELPADVVQQTRKRYVEAYEKLTGKAFG
jgi:phosphoribosylaminoimidazole-succinocarboxamide synthase